MTVKKALLYGAIALGATSILAASSYAAFGGGKRPRIDFDSAPAEVQAIITQAKEEGRDSITDEQKDVLKAYHEAQKEAHLDELPDDIRALVEKAHDEGKDSLTDDERETLRQYHEENGGGHRGG